MTTPTREELLKLAKEAGAEIVFGDIEFTDQELERFATLHAEWLSAHQAQGEPVAQTTCSIADLQAFADGEYCRYTDQLRRDECLGVEYKLANGKFGQRELDAHCKAAAHLGAHKSIHLFINSLKRPLQAQEPSPVTDEMPLPCPELSMPLHGKPSVHLYTGDQMRERDAMWQAKLNAALSRAQTAQQTPVVSDEPSEQLWLWLLGKETYLGEVIEVYDETARVRRGDDEFRILISELIEQDYAKLSVPTIAPVSEQPAAQTAGVPEVEPTAWLHDDEDRVDVIHNEVKNLWLSVKPERVKHYTIPLFSKHTAAAAANEFFGAYYKRQYEELIAADPQPVAEQVGEPGFRSGWLHSIDKCVAKLNQYWMEGRGCTADLLEIRAHLAAKFAAHPQAAQAKEEGAE